MPINETLLVNRSDFSDLAIVKDENYKIKEGFIRVEIGPFALTSNNITYMVVGDQIGYWNFFDPKNYGIEMEGFGRMPVWGYGRVTHTKCQDFSAGSLIYGFFPIAKEIDLKPIKVTEFGFQDGNEHRQGLHPVYNTYNFTSKDPSFQTDRLFHLNPVLRPLFTTSFLIDDFLADENFFGAEQVLLLSASSKTAMGTAYCLQQRGGIKVAGLTSEGNKPFTEKTGFYHEVYNYDTITDMNPDIKTVVVDMAGNGTVMNTVYDHFEENIVYNCMVGKSHWQGAAPTTPKLGAPAKMFFAPDRVKLRMKDWGGQAFAKNLAARWLPFCETAKDWLDIETSHEVTDLLKTYKNFLDGKASPAKGYLFKL